MSEDYFPDPDQPSELDLVYDDLWRLQGVLRRLVNLIDNDGLLDADRDMTTVAVQALREARQLLETAHND